MKAITIVVIFIVLASAMFISGCTAQSTIKNPQQAGEAVNNMSNEVSSVSNTLTDIDNVLNNGGK